MSKTSRAKQIARPGAGRGRKGRAGAPVRVAARLTTEQWMSSSSGLQQRGRARKRRRRRHPIQHQRALQVTPCRHQTRPTATTPHKPSHACPGSKSSLPGGTESQQVHVLPVRRRRWPRKLARMHAWRRAQLLRAAQCLQQRRAQMQQPMRQHPHRTRVRPSQHLGKHLAR